MEVRTVARLRAAFAAARAGDPAEAEQSIIRLVANLAIDVFLICVFLWDGRLESDEVFYIAIMLGGLLLSLGHFAWMLLRPGVDHTRRRAVVWLDLGATAPGIALLGDLGLMLYWVFPWVVLGNGIRYGRWYLHYAHVAAVVLFLVVVLAAEYWRARPMLGAALLFVLVAIPWYVSLLLARLEAARASAEAANLSKTRFLAAASHDLRQPMQALSVYVSVLEDKARDPALRPAMQGAQLCMRTLERLFDGVLDVSRIDAGVIKPKVAAVELMPLIEGVVELERPLAALKGLELRVVRTSAWARTDPGLLERILKNLVTNAVRYTERGGILIGCRRLGADALRLEVIDSGMGIPPVEQQRIFEDYYQISGRSAQGLGLGLPIVKSLAGLLGHRVTLRSSPGRGSIFGIEMARVDAVASAPVAPAAQAGLAGMNVVVVDDDPEIRRSMRLLLETWGCRAFVAGSAAEAERELREQSATPHALIVDYHLESALSGMEAIGHLRAAFGALLPALIISGTPRTSLPEQDIAGIPFAAKPVSPGKLRAFLSSAMDQSQAYA